ncbi:MAG: glycosyltransferase [Candidatus Aminicenantes bacterium]|nr:glycosyltransferase [Candidatus Aminicenantes bacterium]
MKICLISFHCCPFSLIGGDGVGGMNVYIKELCSALTQFPDVEVDIFTRRQRSDINTIKTISSSLRVIHLKGGPVGPVDRRDLYDFLPEFIEDLEEFLVESQKKYDVVYSHYWLSGLVGEWIKYRFGVPLVHTYHTLGFLKNRALGEGEHDYRIEAERHLAQVSDQIISSSLEEKNILRGEYNLPAVKTKVIYPGVNQEIFCLREREGETENAEKNNLSLLYVGRIEPVKGLMSIIQALDLIKHDDPGLFSRLHLKIVGGGKKQEFVQNREIVRIQQTIEDKNLKDQVFFLGSKRQKELRQHYAAADALVVPSLYESFGLVVVEAMACGTPVLVSKIGKMKSIVREGHSGFSFRPDDPASLAACIRYFFSHQKSLWVGEKIREDVIGRFSWERTADESYGVFRSLIDNPLRPTTTLPRGGNPLQA